MPQCCVYGCKKPGGHYFPKCAELKQVWLNAVCRKNWAPTKTSVVCYRHFLTSDFVLESAEGGFKLTKRRLKRNTVPTVFSWINNISKTASENATKLRLEDRSSSNRLHALDQMATMSTLVKYEPDDPYPCDVKEESLAELIVEPKRELLQFEKLIREEQNDEYDSVATETSSELGFTPLPIKIEKYEPEYCLPTQPAALPPEENVSYPSEITSVAPTAKQEMTTSNMIPAQTIVCHTSEVQPTKLYELCANGSKSMYFDNHCEVKQQWSFPTETLQTVSPTLQLVTPDTETLKTIVTPVLQSVTPITRTLQPGMPVIRSVISVKRILKTVTPTLQPVTPETGTLQNVMAVEKTLQTIAPRPNTAETIVPDTTSSETLVPGTIKVEEVDDLPVIEVANSVRPSCDMCDYEATSASDLAEHKSSHRVKGSYSCQQCPYSCVHLSSIKSHLRYHTAKLPFKCSECTFSCVGKNSIKRHIVSHTRGHTPFKCQECPFICQWEGTLLSHVRGHVAGVRFRCTECTYECKSKYNMDQHMLVHSVGELPIKCSKCPYTSRWVGSLKTHMLKHTGEMPCKCGKCAYKCKWKYSLKQHDMLVHSSGKMAFKCQECPFETMWESKLKPHMRKHTRGSGFKCQECTYRCRNTTGLTAHMAVHRTRLPIVFQPQ